MSNVRVQATTHLITSFRDVGTRQKGEWFTCPEWLANELEAVGQVRRETPRPNSARASTAGPVKQRSSSQAGRASPKGK